MGFFGTARPWWQARKATLAAIVAACGIGVGLFLVGVWLGSSSTFTPGAAPATVSHANAGSGQHGKAGMDCDKMMKNMKGTAGAGHPGDAAGPGGQRLPMESMPMHKTMPMDKKTPTDKAGQQADKDCCDK